MEKRIGRWTWCQQRLSEIERLVEHRRGGDFDTPLENYLIGAMWPLLWIADRGDAPAHRSSVLDWTKAHVGSLTDQEPEWFERAEIRSRGCRRDPYRRSDSIAKLLDVTWEERLTLGFTTIGAIDMDWAARAVERKRANAALQKAKRLQAGAKPRALSTENDRPWETEGVSRRTWYRRRAVDGTLSSASSGTVSSATSESVSDPTLPGSDAVSSASLPDGTVSSALGYGVSFEPPRNSATSSKRQQRRASEPARRQAETDLDAAIEAAGIAAERERSELLAGSAPAERPAGEAARPARASHHPRAPRSTAPAQLQAPLAPAAGKRGRPSRRFGEFEMIEIAGVVIGEACMDRRRCWVAIHRGRTIGTHRTKGAAVEDVKRREQQLEMPLVGVIDGGPPAPSPAPTKPARRPRTTPAERAADQIVKESLKAAKDAERASARFYQDVIQRSTARRRTSAQAGMWIYGRPSRRR